MAVMPVRGLACLLHTLRPSLLQTGATSAAAVLTAAAEPVAVGLAATTVALGAVGAGGGSSGQPANASPEAAKIAKQSPFSTFLDALIKAFITVPSTGVHTNRQ